MPSARISLPANSTLPSAPAGISRREAIIATAAALASVTEARATSLDRVIIVDGWVVKQSELRAA